MATEVYMPKMSDHMEAGELVSWLVKEGESVKQGEPIAEINTDKTVAEVEAPASGVVKGIRKGLTEGTLVPVGETLCYIANEDEQVPELPAFGRASAPSGEPGRSSQSAASSTAAAAAESNVRPGSGAVRATPFARRVAKDLGVDIAHVPGSGPGGRIRDSDVRAFASARNGGGEASAGEEWVELTSNERTMGRRMVESIREIPQFTLQADVDMDAALKESKEAGVSVTALLVSTVARTLRQFPRLNSSLENQKLHVFREVNMGVAVATTQGLLVPVIRGADRQGPAAIARELATFRDRAAGAGLRAEDIAGGTFTISNLGMFHVDRFTAIVNPPQTAILAVGQIARRPVAIGEDAIGLRSMMTVSLSADHRVVDGAYGARFLSALKDALEGAMKG